MVDLENVQCDPRCMCSEDFIVDTPQVRGHAPCILLVCLVRLYVYSVV